MSQLRGDGDAITLDEIGISLQAVFTVSSLLSGSPLNGVSWTFSTDRNNYYVWYNVTDALAGVSDPALSGVGIPVSLTTAQTANGSVIMGLTLAQLSKLSEITVAQTASALTVTMVEFGDVTDAVAAASPFGVAITVSGIDRPVVATKFLEVERALTGSTVTIIGEDGVSYSVANSAGQDFSVEKINLVGSAALVTAVLGGSSATPQKTDNRPLSGVS